ncbi:MAG TPA: hypothetical protein VLA74_12300 [Nitrososphaeraceae archaeon]|nr:hypothetical protein [Nitrososphaeraceae archaeon]
MTHKTGNIGFGNLTGLRPMASNNNNDNNDSSSIKIMRISYDIYEKLRDHSRKYHDQPISYDDIFEELCTFYNEHHERKYSF